MPQSKRIVATDLTVADLKRLLVTKKQIAPLQEKKAKLEVEIAAVDSQLAKLAGGAKPGVRRGRKPGRPAAKKAGRRAGKKVGRRVAKKTVRRVAKKGKAPVRQTGIQDVVVKLIRANGKPMAFQAILAAIKKGKLVKTKSKDFQNVLRRTLSTSTVVKRVGRGIYGV